MWLFWQLRIKNQLIFSISQPKHYKSCFSVSISNQTRRGKDYLKYRLSRLEYRLLRIIRSHNLPYKFVGHGTVTFDGKCPDFIHNGNKKIILEVYSTVEKNKHQKGGVERWKETRTKIYSRFGFQVLFLSEEEINEHTVLSYLRSAEIRARVFEHRDKPRKSLQ